MATMDANPEKLKIKMFQVAMDNFHQYPYNLNLGHTTEKVKFFRDFRQHFDQTKSHILLVLRPNVKGFRRKLIEKLIRVEFHDAGLRDVNSGASPSTSTTASGQPPTTGFSIAPGIEPGTSVINFASYYHDYPTSWNSVDDAKVFTVSNSGHLEDLLGISSTSTPCDSRQPDGKSTSLNQQGVTLRRDPVCRFIFLPTSPAARRIKITEELLLKILTYHQVSPCFLNLISYFGHEPLSGAGDLFFGGFRSLKSFSEPVFGLEALGRSGYHYQLAFEFRTVFRPSSQPAEYGDDWQPGGRKPHRLSGEPDVNEYDRNNPLLWPVNQCVIYHHFDVENGRSLWLMTADDDGPNNQLTASEAGLGPRFRDIKDSRFTIDVGSNSPIEERFRASLSVVLWLADWLLSEYGQYITTLDDDLQQMTQIYVGKVTGNDGRPVSEYGLKYLNGYMEKVDEVIVALQGNLRVCRAIIKFYRDELLQDRKLRARKLAWTTDKASRARIREHLDEFLDRMRWTCTSMQEMHRRALIIKQVGARRENTLHRLVQNRDLQTTNNLAKATNELTVVTNRDSSTMRVFSAITLILLPASVVSTVFSAGIVDFQERSGEFVGNWSGPAAVWWAGITIVLTVLVRWFGERWRKRAIAAATNPGTATSNESWMTQVRRTINDWRSHAHPYKFRVRVRYDRVVDLLKTPVIKLRAFRLRASLGGGDNQLAQGISCRCRRHRPSHPLDRIEVVKPWLKIEHFGHPAMAHPNR
ncbi:hypothetical protein N657DRAFT_631727 [Parathielavia appendiculata]|uniref:CorA-like transporter domain-containing protein n=1 Tax=Parathielavia appendiculata TaxID=2587402 RepID=A0AAN6U2Z3_9PEZI|nr:hypothetical protein N657DRAFT_631727 [Parathielavia appendiculata]